MKTKHQLHQETMLRDLCVKFGMEDAGNFLFSHENFLDNHDLPCYVPENAEDVSDIFSRNDLKKEITEWLEQDEVKQYLTEAYDGNCPEIDEDFIEGEVIDMYENLSWEFPSTYLDCRLM